MLVCLCKAVSDRKLADEIRSGCVSLRQIRQSCGAGSDCGACVPTIRQMLRVHGPATSGRSEGGRG